MPTGVNQSDRIKLKTRVAELAVAGGEPMFQPDDPCGPSEYRATDSGSESGSMTY